MADTSLGPVVRHIRRLLGPPGTCGPTDACLLERFAFQGDEDAFAELVRRHGPLVWRVCRRVLRHTQQAEEAYQATFLVLARRAARVRKPASLASFLYGVAYRVARQARQDALRRHQVPERGPAVAPVPDPSREAAWRELEQILVEEVHALPEKYRAPVLLCYWEGRTNEEAAAPRGWGAGLLTARRLLHERLTRRGVGLSAGAILTLFVPAIDAAAPPAGAAVLVGESAQVAALAEAVIRSTAPVGARLALALLVATGAVAAGIGALAYPGPAARPPETRPAEAGRPRPAEERQPMRLDRFGDPLPPGAVARLGSLRLYHGQQVKHVALSPDGKWVVSTAADGNRLWDAITGREQPLPGGLMRAAFRQAAVFATRDKLLAVENRNGDLHLWDVATGETIGQPLAGALVGQLPATIHLCSPLGLSPLALAPDGRTLAVCNLGPDGQPVLRFCDMIRGRVEEPVALNVGPLTATRLAFSGDGKTLVLQCNDSTVHVWDVARRSERIASPPKAEHFGGPIALSPDGTVLATAPMQGKRVRLWDTRTLEELPPLAGQPDKIVQPMTFSPDGKVLAVTCGEPTVRLWDLATRKEKQTLQGKDFYVDHVAFSADGKSLAGSDGYGATLWDLPAGKLRDDFGHTYHVDSVCFSPDGRRLVSGAGYTDNLVRLWDPLTGEPLSQLRGHLWGSEVVAYSPDGKLIASGSQDKTIRLWDADTGREVRRVEAKDSMIYAMAFAPDGKTIASGGQRKAVHLWDVATGRELRSFDNPGAFILRLAFSPDGKWIATRGIDEKEIRIWDIAKGEPIRRLPCSKAGVPSLAFSPDGQTLAAGGDDATVRLWDVTIGEQRRTLAVPLEEAGRTFSIAFSPDGRTLAAGNGEGGTSAIRLWELSSGRVRALLEGAHAQGICSLAFSPDGTLLASGGVDRLIMVWDMTGRRTGGLPPKIRLAPDELNALWESLADQDPRKAYRAVQTLCGSPGPAVSLLREHLHPAPAIDERGIDRWIADLDSDQFEVRQKAYRHLRELGNAAEPALRKTFAGKLSVEQRLRIKELLQEADPTHFPQRLRELRAVEVLEHVGTAEAQAVLKTLAAGAVDARLTREAKASLERMRKKQATGR